MSKSRVPLREHGVRFTRFARSSGLIYIKDTELRSRGLIYKDEINRTYALKYKIKYI
ncbi:MAG: hypothetical protein NHB15_04425 [Methanosarcina barkeri]|nr:hypothetical protein [Methanosarcina sp. ERenArc_MAG2]